MGSQNLYRMYVKPIVELEVWYNYNAKRVFIRMRERSEGPSYSGGSLQYIYMEEFYFHAIMN